MTTLIDSSTFSLNFKVNILCLLTKVRLPWSEASLYFKRKILSLILEYWISNFIQAELEENCLVPKIIVWIFLSNLLRPESLILCSLLTTWCKIPSVESVIYCLSSISYAILSVLTVSRSCIFVRVRQPSRCKFRVVSVKTWRIIPGSDLKSCLCQDLMSNSR